MPILSTNYSKFLCLSAYQKFGKLHKQNSIRISFCIQYLILRQIGQQLNNAAKHKTLPKRVYHYVPKISKFATMPTLDPPDKLTYFVFRNLMNNLLTLYMNLN